MILKSNVIKTTHYLDRASSILRTLFETLTWVTKSIYCIGHCPNWCPLKTVFVPSGIDTIYPSRWRGCHRGRPLSFFTSLIETWKLRDLAHEDNNWKVGEKRTLEALGKKRTFEAFVIKKRVDQIEEFHALPAQFQLIAHHTRRSRPFHPSWHMFFRHTSQWGPTTGQGNMSLGYTNRDGNVPSRCHSARTASIVLSCVLNADKGEMIYHDRCFAQRSLSGEESQRFQKARALKKPRRSPRMLKSPV